ncbi:MAG: spore coat protein [Oscillospiraceae bacterium]|jgi:rubrerythrin|nr:spore coat protein [Oscillospiraceae bacterium]MBQ8930672.1 spore coat protein [Oscillospiraceae bacterium]MBR6430242.1 spore coat protein [Oscillospiraceae bacterium]
MQMGNLTEKELTALEDQLGSEQTLVANYRALAEMCSDGQIRQSFLSYADQHQQHFNTLMNFLK